MIKKQQDINTEFDKESRELKNLLSTMTTDKRDNILDTTRKLRKSNRELAAELGPQLREMRPQLIQERKWGMVVYQIARLTGVAYNTILNWTDGDYSIPKGTMKKIEIDETLNQAIQKLLAAGFDITKIAEKAVEKAVEIGNKQQKDLRQHIHDFTAQTYWPGDRTND